MIKVFGGQYNGSKVSYAYSLSKDNPNLHYKFIFSNGNYIFYLLNGKIHNPYGLGFINNFHWYRVSAGYKATKLYYYNNKIIDVNSKKEYKRLIKLMAFK